MAGRRAALDRDDPLICLVDDDDAVLDSLQLLLEVEGFRVRTFRSAEALLEAPPEAVACIVSDVRMPGIDGLQLLTRLGGAGIRAPVILITGHGDIPMAVRAMQLGAVDFLEKPFAPERLFDGLRRALAAPTAPGAATAAARQRLATLTPRERDVFVELAAGRANKEIARVLAISPRTVEVHRARVMEKMSAGNLADLVRLAITLGVGPPLR